MAAISQTIFSDTFVSEKFCILIEITLKFVPKGPIDHNPAVVYLMACRHYLNQCWPNSLVHNAGQWEMIWNRSTWIQRRWQHDYENPS